ncbi:hypothetical protein SAMN03159294_2700 [Kosakonia radicincitans]|nr:hypothetical protein SAMN03159294_2700 [Kosakonia radicincitans]
MPETFNTHVTAPWHVPEQTGRLSAVANTLLIFPLVLKCLIALSLNCFHAINKSGFIYCFCNLILRVYYVIICFFMQYTSG